MISVKPKYTSRFLALTLTSWLVATAAADEVPLPDLVPDPALTAINVVRIQLAALSRNDTPRPDAGIEITFRFASPDNRRQTGPLPRFIQLVKTPVYSPMVAHRAAKVGEPMRSGDKQMVTVVLTARNGAKAAYMFILGKQTEDCDGCWMTEAVMRIPMDHVRAGSELSV